MSELDIKPGAVDYLEIRHNPDCRPLRTQNRDDGICIPTIEIYRDDDRFGQTFRRTRQKRRAAERAAAKAMRKARRGAR